MKIHHKARVLIITVFLLGTEVCARNSNEHKNIPVGTIEYLKVVDVETNDTLNIREAATNKSVVTYQLPYNASGIVKLGAKNGWVRLSYKEHIGWAYGKYLQSTTAPNLAKELPVKLFCLGTEPHWILESNKNVLRYKKYNDEGVYIVNSTIDKASGKDSSWLFSAVKEDFSSYAIKIHIQGDEQCSDGMSDSKYSYSITVIDYEKNVMKGCCK